MGIPESVKLSVRTKLLGTAGVLLVFMAVVGGLGIVNLRSLNSTAQDMYANRVLPIQQLGAANVSFMNIRRLATSGVAQIGDASAQAKVDADIAAGKALIKAEVDAYGATELLDSEKNGLAKFQADYATYLASLDGLRAVTLTGDTEASLTAMKATAANAGAVSDDLAALIAINTDVANAQALAVDSTATSGTLLALALILGAAIVGFGLALVLARLITGGVRAVQTTLTSMTEVCAANLENGLGAFARNDLTVEVHPQTHPIEKYGSDEIGATAAVTNRMLGKLQATIESYETARAGLTTTVGEVKTAADSVARTSAEVSAAATQAGTASSQIASTISQVASGAAEQAKASSDTSGAVVELNAIITQVGAGAGDVTAKVDGASIALNDMAGAISSATTASGDVANSAAAVAAATDHGQKAVRETVAEMERIKHTVMQASAKVTELGAKSGQIGAIVETIDDIAEQTNLLALNAAIEAARAGEQGKGFAVVADEVRKLAERSSRATKEISTLIDGVQKGTEEAVAAMQAGAEEVEHGSELAAQAGSSLDDISDAVATASRAVDRVTFALEEMSRSSAGVVSASDAIATIAAQVNAASVRMASSARTVGGSIESIAAISEENSASAEEVSAATEEMSAQAEEVVASAASLAQMADELDEVVARFTLGPAKGAPAAKVLERRHEESRARAA
jgi:methyl-accepting chemotaxis protein